MTVTEVPIPPAGDSWGIGLSDKALLLGTHRVLDADTTWKRIEPHLSRIGVTRLADVTMLDDIGIPVWQAVQPNAKSLSVSQGKGVSHELARISAVMEALECWHAEEGTESVLHSNFRDLEGELSYKMRELDLEQPGLLTERVMLDWLEGVDLGSGHATLVPERCVTLDLSTASAFAPPLFSVSSNGLASGNTLEEATLHALLELLERDLVASTTGGRSPNRPPLARLDLTSVDGHCSAMVLEKLREAGVHVRVHDCGIDGLACFTAAIWSEELPYTFTGSGCHFDRDVALSRALTEAAQSRLTAIAGTRDDLPPAIYRSLVASRSVPRPWSDSASELTSFEGARTIHRPFIADDIKAALSIIEQRAGRHPVRVDLTRQDIGIPVVRVIAPGLSRRRH
ncbi:YcaO-like family protein [Streptomyces sp. NPDC099088]|uniref:YcaO-like family protein n=1 Tax=Streptomyces sp. NPDC099088 TaxID=3366101 RepID=UPI0037FF884A